MASLQALSKKEKKTRKLILYIEIKGLPSTNDKKIIILGKNGTLI
jgi:hypothetical protein